jgi:hypothetical protein
MTRNLPTVKTRVPIWVNTRRAPNLDIQEYFLHPSYDINFNFIPAILSAGTQIRKKIASSMKSGSHAQRDAATDF